MDESGSLLSVAVRESGGIFSKMSDSRAVVQFVREIEKHPCLYDQKSVDYANRALKTKTWIQIAKKCHCTVAECKEKWRKIRIAYIRTLKPSYNNGLRSSSRPYYLASYLKFISPNNKKLTKDSSNISKDEQDENVSVKEDESEDVANITVNRDENTKHQVFLNMDNNCFDESEESLDDFNDCEIIDSKESILNETNEMKELKEVRSSNHNNITKIEKRKICCDDLECNPRKMFLLSLLPDIESFTEQQMRIFRREVIDLMDRVIDE